MSVFFGDSAPLAELVSRIDERYRPVWIGKPPAYQRALTDYFLPHNSSKPALSPSRPRVVKWYCPFAHQAGFPSGHRYCINVYSGCAHGCEYCYAASYEPKEPRVKRDFARMLAKDMADLEDFGVPAAPVHLSNSTDPFQPLEAQAGHTRLALEQILAHRKRFTSVVILTKNPALIVKLGCADVLRQLAELPQDHPNSGRFAESGAPACLLEVSLAFLREPARQQYDPHAPSVEDRVAGLRQLADAGIPAVLRIDPLFLQSPVGGVREYRSFGLEEPQTIDDLEQLVLMAKQLRVRHIVYSPAKIVQPRTRPLSPVMARMRAVYEYAAAPEKLAFRGGSWRLPGEIQAKVTRPLLEICRREGLAVKCCKQNLVETP